MKTFSSIMQACSTKSERARDLKRCKSVTGLLILVAAAGSPLQPTTAALDIFQRDWVLMNWALKYYDADRDILIEPNEALAAADAFRRIADTDDDGRVTPKGYRVARAFILARY